MTKKRIHSFYAIALSIVTVIAGICLICACIHIYRSGDRPFSAEAVQAAFATISIPVYLCIALICGGFVLDIFSPLSTKKTTPPKQSKAILESYYKNATPEQLNNEELRLRKRDQIINLVLLILCSGIFLIYATNGKNFNVTTLNKDMAAACRILLACMAAPFIFAIYSAYRAKASMLREIEYFKQLGITRGKVEITPKKDITYIQLIILVVAVVALVFGFFSGGTNDVLTKAVNICTECVGLG